MRRVAISMVVALAMTACESPPPTNSADTKAADSASAKVADSSTPSPPPTSAKDASVLPDRSVPVVPGDYHFSRDMFTDRTEVWARVLAPFVGKPDLHYLEVGVFEGRSVVWMLENVLTDPSTRVTAIDIFPEDLKQTFLSNMDRSGRRNHVTTVEGLSQQQLRKLPSASIDIAYIDGSHTAADVLADAVLTWELIRPGGVVIFDDFLWVGRGGGKLLPAELRPALGVAAFMATYRDEITVLHRDYQVVLQKVENPCPSKHYCTPLGQAQYVYDWRKKKLYAQGPTPAEVSVSEEERGFIETLLLSRPFGDVGYAPVPALEADSKYVAMMKRLQLKLPPPVGPLSAVDRTKLFGI